MRRCLVLLLALTASSAGAQSWPSRPIRFVAPLSPGTAIDLTARTLGDRLSRSLGQPVVVENLSGAGGMLGTQMVARAAPDGYTLLLGVSGALINAPYFFKQVPYDVERDFSAVAFLVDSGPFVLTAHPDFPADNLPQLIALAKKQPGKLSYATEGTPQGFVGMLLKKRAGIDMVEVRYKSNAQMAQDTLAGRTQLVIGSVAGMDPLVRAGKLKRLLITSASRFPGLEELATADETLPGVIVEGQFFLVGPAGLPSSIAQRLNQTADLFVKDAGVSQKLLALGLKTAPGAGTPEAVAEFLRSERSRWAKLVREVEFEPQ